MYKIRLGTLDDLVALSDIEISAASLFPPGKIPSPHESLPYDVMKEAVRQQLLFCSEFLSTKQTKILVGFAACHLYSRYLHLDEISVLPNAGKQGIGTSLMKHVLECSKKRGCKGTTLTTFSDIAWKAPFYKKLGFNELKFSDTPSHVQAMLEEESSIGLVNRVAMLSTN